MNDYIRHRRLEAFYRSKVLNALMIVVVVSLLLIGYLPSMLFPVLCASTALCLFIAYSLWLWIAKPSIIVVNERLSNINGLLCLYFIVVAAFGCESPWWYIIPSVLAIVVLFMNMVLPSDENYAI